MTEVVVALLLLRLHPRLGLGLLDFAGERRRVTRTFFEWVGERGGKEQKGSFIMYRTSYSSCNEEGE